MKTLTLQRSIHVVRQTKEYIRWGIFNPAIKNRLTHDDILTGLQAMYATDRYQRLPRWGQSELAGYIDAHFDFIWSIVEGRYLINGVYWRFDDAELPYADCSQDNFHHTWPNNRRFVPETEGRVYT